MMLHEAVMLEIYRQALTASELTSPRCQSRESNISAAALDARCPSNGSHCSGGQERSATPANATHPSTPPTALPLQATLAPAAAAALLPPQSAAMAAYFNAAAAAAQQNHLLLTNPLAAAATLVQHATQGHSPTMNRLPTTTTPQTELTADEPVLDFSTKHRRATEQHESDDDDDEEVDDVKLDDDDSGELSNGRPATADANSPLDLSVGRKREAANDQTHMPMRKTLRTAMQHNNNYKTTLPPNAAAAAAAAAAASNWMPTMNPYLAAVAASLSPPKSPLSPHEWSGKHKLMPNEATKALEKMTEMTRLGSATDSAELPQHRQGNTGAASGNAGRHSAWQSHWLNKGADAVRDVFKCVWCKQSFPTLASLTSHMKETQHCGVNMPPTVANNLTAHNSGSSGVDMGAGRGDGCSNGNQPTQSPAHHLRHTSAAAVAAAGTPMVPTGHSSPHNAAAATTNASNKSDLNLLIKETMPLPRKLVRGQDVWLGKGAEQTREILKCMWCGQSFRSLAEMTSHMQETQHYTNIISQEQIISWKSTDDKSSNSGGGGGGSSISAHPTGTTSTSPVVTSPPSGAGTFMPTSPSNNSTASATVSAVLTCKVCDQAFPTLKELSNHMMKNSHFTEHMMRAGGVSGAGGGVVGEQLAPSPASQTTAAARRGRQMREKRKKSLPVRKLLELERDYKNSLDGALKPLRDFAVSTKITCERCGEKVETALFVEHLRKCLGGNIFERCPPRNQTGGGGGGSSGGETLRPTMNTLNTFENLDSPQNLTNRNDGRKTADSNKSQASTRPELLCAQPKEGEKSSNNSTPSVLNALEQLIEKSFDTRTRSGNSYSSNGNGSQRSTPLGSSILKRLGIDDNVDYTKPLIDPQALHYMRSYSNYSARDRSASESSSISERCNGRIESFTPERMSAERTRQASTPRLTPEERLSAVETQMCERVADRAADEEPTQIVDSELLNIKSEPMDSPSDAQEHVASHDNPTATMCEPAAQKISVKKEFNMIDHAEEDERQSNDSSHYKSQTQSACSRADSPSASERSITPKSTTSSGITDKRYQAAASGSSLTALSSMFDNLHNMSSGASSTQLHANENMLSGVEHNNNNNNNNSTTKKGNANPLAALEKLCEKTEKPTLKSRNSASNGINHNNQMSGNMMAFSWACNDAVQASTHTSESAMIKCTQCDAVFSSKGAYRHHFSKVHYVKDEVEVGQTLTSTIKSPLMASSPKSAATSPKSASKSPVGAGSMAAPTINPYSESSQSKFLKYTELAKQLSSKNA